MSSSAIPARVRTLRTTDLDSGRQPVAAPTETAVLPDPFRQTRYHFARLTAVSVTALLLLSALSVLAS